MSHHLIQLYARKIIQSLPVKTVVSTKLLWHSHFYLSSKPKDIIKKSRFCQGFDIIYSVDSTNTSMSGDNLHGTQPPKFYSEEITDAKRILINSNYILEIENMFIASRTRTGSILQE